MNNKREMIHVKYIGNGMVPVGGKMLPSGEIREVRRFLAEEAQRYHPETIVILEDLTPDPSPNGVGGAVEPQSSPAPVEKASPPNEVKDEHQPEQPIKPAAKRRSGAK